MKLEVVKQLGGGAEEVVVEVGLSLCGVEVEGLGIVCV